MSDTDSAGVIAPPPLIFIIGALFGFIADFLWPMALFPGTEGQYAIGGVLVALGCVIALSALLQFRAANTAPEPWHPTTAIVVAGIYRFSRNPMYVAMGLVIAGIGIAVDGIWILIFLAPTLLVIRYGVIAREEAYLARKFGDEYLSYKASVRRWL